jgi:hypothetical protein
MDIAIKFTHQTIFEVPSQNIYIDDSNSVYLDIKDYFSFYQSVLAYPRY